MDRKYLRIFLYVCLVAYFSAFFLRKINLVTADLGRHIMNGRVFLEQGKVVSTNFYSYTQPDLPVVTHHWLSGVVFYLVHGLGSFTGLSVFYVLVSGLTVFMFFKLAEDRSNLTVALFVTILLMPLLSDRKEIRPEGFSYLFMGIYYYALTLFVRGKFRFKYLLPVLLILQVLWVNLHIFFIFGLFILGTFTGWEAVKKWVYKRNNKFKELLFLSLLVTAAGAINPYHIRGLLEPINILKEYGYMIVENQTVLFMQRRSPDFIYFFFELLALVVVFMTLHIFTAKKMSRHAVALLLAWAFMILGFRAIRGMQIFGMFFVPLAAGYIYDHHRSLVDKFVWPLALLLVFTLIPGHALSLYKPGAGLGLAENINGSARFFKEQGLGGPVFNNYDIGGYLIYHLYPQEKVFVDNRPEAYSVDFFADLYEPMQAKEEVWQQALRDYDFNVIYFYRRDRTQWAQPFLIERINDPEWVPVYVDDYVLILVRNDEQNSAVINEYQIPQQVFVVG